MALRVAAVLVKDHGMWVLACAVVVNAMLGSALGYWQLQQSAASLSTAIAPWHVLASVAWGNMPLSIAHFGLQQLIPHHAWQVLVRHCHELYLRHDAFHAVRTTHSDAPSILMVDTHETVKLLMPFITPGLGRLFGLGHYSLLLAAWLDWQSVAALWAVLVIIAVLLHHSAGWAAPAKGRVLELQAALLRLADHCMLQTDLIVAEGGQGFVHQTWDRCISELHRALRAGALRSIPSFLCTSLMTATWAYQQAPDALLSAYLLTARTQPGSAKETMIVMGLVAQFLYCGYGLLLMSQSVKLNSRAIERVASLLCAIETVVPLPTIQALPSTEAGVVQLDHDENSEDVVEQLRLDAPADTIIIPRRPYLPRSATLADVLAYPVSSSGLSDARFVGCLTMVELGHLAPQLHLPRVDWSRSVSTGEAQRICIARALFHHPHRLVLEDATCGLDASTEHRIYRRLERQHIALLTVSSRSHLQDVLEKNTFPVASAHALHAHTALHSVSVPSISWHALLRVCCSGSHRFRIAALCASFVLACACTQCCIMACAPVLGHLLVDPNTAASTLGSWVVASAAAGTITQLVLSLLVADMSCDLLRFCNNQWWLHAAQCTFSSLLLQSRALVETLVKGSAAFVSLCVSVVMLAQAYDHEQVVLVLLTPVVLLFAATVVNTLLAPTIAAYQQASVECQRALLAHHAHLVQFSREVCLWRGGAVEHAALARHLQALQAVHFGFVAWSGVMHGLSAAARAFSSKLAVTTPLALLAGAPLPAIRAAEIQCSATVAAIDAWASAIPGLGASAATLCSWFPCHAELSNTSLELLSDTAQVAVQCEQLCVGIGTTTKLRDLSFQVLRGQCLLVMGPSGCGKTMLLRTIAGTQAAISGRIQRQQHVMYLSNRPFLCTGTLLQMVTYPATGVAPDHTAASTALNLAGLSSLSPQLSECRDWDACLSDVQRQQIGFARVFYHRPALALLDESSSHMHADLQHRLWSCLRGTGTTVISAGHRQELIALHDVVMVLK